MQSANVGTQASPKALSKFDRIRNALNKMTVITAVLAIVVLIAIQVLLFQFLKVTNKVIELTIPAIITSFIVILLVDVANRLFLQSISQMVPEEEIENLAAKIAGPVIQEMGKLPSLGEILKLEEVVIYDHWYAIQWDSLISNCKHLEVAGAYFDTWFDNGGQRAIQTILESGGTVHFVITDQSEAKRLNERFPEFDISAMRSKLRITPEKLKSAWVAAANNSSQLEVRTTKIFMMHSLLRVDRSILFICPYDHFRRGNTATPAFRVRLEGNPQTLAWAEKEFSEFWSNGNVVLKMP